MAALMAAAAFMVGRRPDALFNPQFWAEDGAIWFSQQYNHGIAALLLPYAGYLQTLPRLAAIPAVHLSLTQAALLFNLVGLAVQVAPVAFLISRRLDTLLPQTWARLAMAGFYLMIPGQEVDVNLTNAQWHLALLAILVLVAEPPAHRLTRGFDALVLVLCGLTGPFALLLLPIAVARAAISRLERRWYSVLAALVGLTAIIQALTLLHAPRPAPGPLGANLADLVDILANRIVIPASLARESAGFTAVFQGLALHAAIAVIAIALFAWVLIRGSWSARLLVAFCLGITGAGLLAPLAGSLDQPAWRVLATSLNGARYFLLAQVAWGFCVLWAVSSLRHRHVRNVLVAVLAVCAISGVVAHPQYPPYIDDHLGTYAARLASATRGEVVVVPINPGPPWHMVLIRR
ncbi:MAG: hypothetical protein ACYDAC_03115 [Candidatus Dormibacteria bacterium]